MITNLIKQDLIDFEEDIANEFNSGSIRAPVHLYNGNEDEMLKVFENIREEDWIFTTWRSHYQCLLKGVPKDLLKKQIMNGHSISLCFPKYRIFSSAIVTGNIGPATGVALGIKRSGKDEKVYCFVGDMSATTGIFHECWCYSTGFDLPITFIIEDNDKSVCTDTKKTWGVSVNTYNFMKFPKIYYYKYESKWPHSGASKRVLF